MAKKRKLPLVAICGRPNVGKSTLFNRITGRQHAIVHSEEGITRDRRFAPAQWKEHAFRMVDTGGIIENPLDPVSNKMQDQVRAALEEANVLLFVVDGQQDLTRVDMEVRDALFKYSKPVVLAVNKCDNPEQNMNRFDFYELGLGEPYAVSSGHGLGMDELLDALLEHFPKEPVMVEEDDRKITRVAIVGKPNVGKSSFVNAILNEERTIVDSVAGTTRDAIDVDFHWKGKDYLLIDTAGLRRKAGIKQKVEHYSVARSLRSVRRADVCCILMDATEGISEQDKRIMGYCKEQGTAMLFVWTKWDLIEDKERKFKAIDDEIDLKIPYFKYIPYMTLSNLTRQRLLRPFEYIDRVAEAAEFRIATGEMNRIAEEIRTAHKPSSQKGKRAKIYYMTQASVKPTTFILFVNQKRLFHFSYLRYIENQIRERYPFDGVPITLELRQGDPQKSREGK
jgi:GTPase